MPKASEGRKLIYIVVLNWNGWQDTIECLESVFRSDYPSHRVIVCDNGSEDGSLEHIKAWAEGRLDVALPKSNPLRHLSFPPVTKPIPYVEHDRAQAERGGNPADADCRLVLIQTGANLGFAGGCNVGLRYALSRADFDYVWLLNNDAVVADPQVLNHLVRASDGLAICSTVTLDYYSGQAWFTGGTISWLVGGPTHSRKRRKEGVYDTRFISGCNMFIPSGVFAESELLDERFFLGMEDCVLSYRALRYGRPLKVVNRDSVYHKVGRTNRFSRFTIANSYACKSFWMRETGGSPLGVLLWLMVFTAMNVLIRVPLRLALQKIRGIPGDLGIMGYWALSARALIGGLKASNVSLKVIGRILE